MNIFIVPHIRKPVLFFFFSKVSEAPGTYFGLKILAVPKLVVKTISASLLPHYVFDVIVLLKKKTVIKRQDSISTAKCYINKQTQGLLLCLLRGALPAPETPTSCTQPHHNLHTPAAPFSTPCWASQDTQACSNSTLF